MKQEDALKILNTAIKMTKEQIKEKIGMDQARNACARFRDAAKVDKETAKLAFDVYTILVGKNKPLSILANLAEKAGIKYEFKPVEKDEKTTKPKKTEKKAPEKKPEKTKGTKPAAEKKAPEKKAPATAGKTDKASKFAKAKAKATKSADV